MPDPQSYDLRLEPGASGLELAAALVKWLQRECGAVAGEYDLQGNVVSIPLRVSARRVARARTLLRSTVEGLCAPPAP